MTLTLVSAEHSYNVYEDEDGEEILGTPLPVVSTLTLWDEFDLSAAWFAAVEHHRQNPPMAWSYRPDRQDFVEEIRRQIADMDDVHVVWCQDCEDPTKGDEAVEVDGGGYHACSSCFEENYRSCDDCGNAVHYDSITSTLSGDSVCSRCSDNNYSYCEDCDGYYHDGYSDEHRHGGCQCEAPTLSVTMRNGDAMLAEDERIAVSLPSGVISEEGIHSILRLVREYGRSLSDGTGAGYDLYNKWWHVAHEIPAMDAHWQTKEGNFTKRFSKLAHKSQGLKVPAELLTKVGNIARENSAGSEINIELTRNLNLSAEEFYHEDSCWWQSYSESRCALKSNGGIGMRTFGGFNGQEVQGRAWIMPLRLDGEGRLQPTFDSLTPDAYMVFNGYGDLSGYTPARVVAGMAGMTYRKMSFYCSPMYVNGNSGYLVTSEEIAAKYAERGGLSLDLDQHARLYDREQVRELATV